MQKSNAMNLCNINIILASKTNTSYVYLQKFPAHKCNGITCFISQRISPNYVLRTYRRADSRMFNMCRRVSMYLQQTMFIFRNISWGYCCAIGWRANDNFNISERLYVVLILWIAWKKYKYTISAATSF